MTKEEIIQAVDQGKRVFWKNFGYEVIKDKKGQYLIKCGSHRIGLFGAQGKLNGEPADFFISKTGSIISI